MRHTNIEASRVRLAQVRYFNAKENASEIPEEKAYAFLVNVNGTYINPFNPLEEVPVYDRVWYGNVREDGESYGTKIVLVNGEVQEGVCYILESFDVRDIFEKEVISMKDIEDYMFDSDAYFIDRIELIENRKLNPMEKLRRNKKIVEDIEKGMKLKEYLIREKQIQKNKVD